MTREEIKSLRKLQKLSQAELGQRVNLSGSEISRIECGYRDVTTAEAAALAAALKPAPQVSPPPVPPSPPAPKGLALAAAGEKVDAPAVVKPAVSVEPVKSAAAVPPAATIPTGSDLNDPTRFGVLPDLELLAPDALRTTASRARLSAELAQAGKILHTSRIPAAVWRAWRQFEQQATERLRSAAVEAPPPAPVQVTEPIAPVTADEMSIPVKSESKSLNSLFVQAARGVLPAEITERLNQAAEAAHQADASIGFMKHFRRIAEMELTPAQLQQVSDRASSELATPDRWRTRRGRGQAASAK